MAGIAGRHTPAVGTDPAAERCMQAGGTAERHTQAVGAAAWAAEYCTQAVGIAARPAECRMPVFDTADRRTVFQKN